YTFTGLTPGVYQVAATWPGGTSAAAAYTVFDGQQPLAAATISQFQDPNGFLYDGVYWNEVGIFYVTGTTLVVQVSQQSSSSAPALADGVRIQRLIGDGGDDDNFHVQDGSPTIDQGDLTSPYSLEPAPNGARVNQGFDGNTPNAHTSANPLLQVLSPNGNEKYEIDGTYTITWREVGIPGSGNHVVIELIQGQTVITQIAPPTTLDTGSFLWHVIDDGT